MANLVYQNAEAAKWFVPAAATQAEDAIFEVDGLASGAGHQSAQLDLGDGARAQEHTWRAFVQFATVPVVGEVVEVYLKTSETTGHPDNDDGTGDLAVSAEDKLRNLHFLGTIMVDEALANIEMVASGFIWIPWRHVQVVFWNRTADALTTDVDENGFALTPTPMEVQ